MKKMLMLLLVIAVFGSLMIGTLSAPIQQGPEQKNVNIESIQDEFTPVSHPPKLDSCDGDPHDLGGGFRGHN